MNQQTSTQNLSFRIAAEAQLLAEEKWIIDALRKIRIQRNCLQIERLEMENMRAKILKNMGENKKTNVAVEDAPQQDEKQPTDFDLSTYLQDLDTLCNDEELDLNVSAPVYNGNANMSYEVEEDEEEEDEEEENEDESNVIDDMNMLMNGCN